MEDHKQAEHDRNPKGPISSGMAPGPGEHLVDSSPQSTMATSQGNPDLAAARPATPGGQDEHEWRWPRSELTAHEYDDYRGGRGNMTRSRTMLESAGERVRGSRVAFVAGTVAAGFLLQRFLQAAPAQRSGRRGRADIGYAGADASQDADREYGLDTAYAPELSAGAGDASTGAMNQIADRVRQAGDSARTRLRTTTDDARARMRDMGQLARSRYYDAKGRVDTTMEERPLLIGALGIALGAGLGAMLATTRRENELMGDMRDKVMDKARETASSQMQTVKDSARRVADAAREEAERTKTELSSAVGGGNSQSGKTAGDAGSRTDTRPGIR